jgi:putative MFS transporter
MTNMQWLIWGLAAAGKFFEGVVVFTTGVALPLMAKEFALGATEKGVIAAASLFGILIGATALGASPIVMAASRCSSSRWCCSPSSSCS